MNKWIFFGIGVAVGSAVTFISVKKHYAQLAYTEINEVRESYKRKIAAKEIADRNDEEKKKLLRDISKDSKFYDEAQKAVQKYMGKTEKSPKKTAKTDAEGSKSRNFNVFSNPPDADELDLEDDEDDISDDPYEFVVDRTGPAEEYEDAPFEITEEEFASDKLFYDKVLIELYDDGVAVLEESDTVLEEPIEDLIGSDILGDVEPDEDDMIYVRNNARSTDYGIIFVGQSFMDRIPPEEGSR